MKSLAAPDWRSFFVFITWCLIHFCHLARLTLKQRMYVAYVLHTHSAGRCLLQCFEANMSHALVPNFSGDLFLPFSALSRARGLMSLSRWGCLRGSSGQWHCVVYMRWSLYVCYIWSGVTWFAMCTRACVVTQWESRRLFGPRKTVFWPVPGDFGDICLYIKGFLICSFGVMFDALTPCESIPCGFILSNCLDSGGCRSDCTGTAGWHAVVLMKNIQSVIDHALILLLYYCTVGSITPATDIVSSVAVGLLWLWFALWFLYMGRFHRNEDGNCWLLFWGNILLW